MLEPTIIKNHIKNCFFKEVSQSVQDFYNGPCAVVDIDDKKNIDEVIELIKKLI